MKSKLKLKSTLKLKLLTKERDSLNSRLDYEIMTSRSSGDQEQAQGEGQAQE